MNVTDGQSQAARWLNTANFESEWRAQYKHIRGVFSPLLVERAVNKLWSLLNDALLNTNQLTANSPEQLPNKSTLAELALALDPRSPHSPIAQQAEVTSRCLILLYDQQRQHPLEGWYRSSLEQILDDLSNLLRAPSEVPEPSLSALRLQTSNRRFRLTPAQAPSPKALRSQFTGGLSFNGPLEAPSPKLDSPRGLGSVSATVTSLEGPWATLTLSGGTLGLIHALEISWWNAWGEARHGLELGQTIHVKALGQRKRGLPLYSLRQTLPNPWEAIIPKELYPGRSLRGQLYYRRNLRSGSILLQMDIPITGSDATLRGSLKLPYRPDSELLEEEHEVVVLALNESQCVIELTLPEGSPLQQYAPPQPDALPPPSPSDILDMGAVALPQNLSMPRLLIVGAVGSQILGPFLREATPKLLILPQGQETGLPPGPEHTSPTLHPYTPPTHRGYEELLGYYQRLIEGLGLEPEGLCVLLGPGASRGDILALGSLFIHRPEALFFVSLSSRCLYRNGTPHPIFRLGAPSNLRGIIEARGVRVLGALDPQSLDPTTHPAAACALLVKGSAACEHLVMGLVRRFAKAKGLDRPLFVEASPAQLKASKALAWKLKQRRQLVSALFNKGAHEARRLGIRLMPQAHLRPIFSQGQWLEMGLAHPLAEHPSVDEIALNVTLDTGASPGQREAQRRFELDILLRQGKQLSLIECKTGGWQEQDFHKLQTIARILGARAYLATLDRRRVQNLKASAERFGITLVHAQALALDPSILTSQENRPPQ